MAISHCYWHLMVRNGNFTLLLTSSGRIAISHCYWHLVVKNGNFTLLLTSSWQLLSLCNWLSSWLHPLHNITSSATFSVLWSSGNFCNTSQNMHSQAPVASQHEKTHKVVWACKNDSSPQRTSTYERPFTQKGNYLVCSCVVMTWNMKVWSMVMVIFTIVWIRFELCSGYILWILRIFWGMFFAKW